MATHSSILAWRIPWTEKPGRLQSMGSQKSDMTWWLNHHHQDVYINSKLLIYLPTSPLVTISLFSMSVILFLFCKKVHLYHFLDPTYKQYNFISFSFPLQIFISLPILSGAFLLKDLPCRVHCEGNTLLFEKQPCLLIARATWVNSINLYHFFP